MTPAEFEDWAARFGPRLRSAAYGFTGDRDKAQDLAQDVLVIMANRRAAISVRGAYLYAMTAMKHAWERDTRREEKRPGLERRTWYERPAGDVSDAADRMSIEAAMSRLRYRERAVLVCRYWGRLTARETANVLSLKHPGRVSEIEARALGELRRLLGGTFEGVAFPGFTGDVEMGGHVDEEPA